MWYGIVLSVLGALFCMVVSRQVARSVREIFVWHRRTREAVIRANTAAAGIQRLLSGRVRSLQNVH